MNLLSSLQFATACLAGLGTLMLGVSEDNYLLAALAVIFSVSSYYLCDVTGRLQLNTWSSNAASLVALAAAAWRYQVLLPEERILAVADLMGYLQFILQFRYKTVRNLWLLAVVSFLQVSVAAALHTGITFALLLTVYLFAGVYFLAIFYLYREQLRLADGARAAETTAEGRGFGLFSRPRSEPSLPVMRRELSRKIVSLGLWTVAMAVFFFIAVPRIGQTNWVPAAIVGPRTVGFSAEINLTRSGEIIEDPEVVMQVKFFDAETDEPYQLDGEPYFRGTSLLYYSHGRWRGPGLRYPGGPVPSPPASGREGLVREQIVIEPLSSTTLFACAPWFSEEADERLLAALFTLQLNRRESARGSRFSYSLLTSAFRNHRQNDLMALPTAIDDLSQLLRMPPSGPDGDSLAQLKTVAATVVAGIPADDVMRRAKALEAYLRDSGRFQYTLQPPPRPVNVDPIEDFIANNPRGHCEYFAGALALMLRSVGIPSRVVVGYRGGELNVVGNFYQVRQLNAHSWVEAYVPPAVVPEERFTIDAQAATAKRLGAWLRLDPTTTNDLALATTGDSRWGEIQQVVDYLKFVWNNYVVGMDSMKQHESIYQPVAQKTQAVVRRLTSRETWREWYAAAVDRADPRRWSAYGFDLWSWRGAVLVPLGAGLAWLAVIAFRKRRRRVQSSVVATVASRRAPVPVDFYLRLERVLAACNLRRTPEQTQREFVQAACGELAESPATRGIAALPRRIVEAFYRVRFGGRPLDDGERQEIEQSLATLTVALAAPRPPGPPSVADGR